MKASDRLRKRITQVFPHAVPITGLGEGPCFAPVPVGEAGLIGPGVALFLPEGMPLEKMPASPCLVKRPAFTGPLPGDWPLRPDFAEGLGRHCASLNVDVGADLYGTGQVVGPMRRNGHSVVLWNTSNPGYHKDQGRRLYESHPWVLGVNPDGSAFGVIFDSSWKAELSCLGGIQFHCQGPRFPVVVIHRPSPKEVLMALADLTGHMELPPLWALGYHQSRYTYEPEVRVRNLARQFRKRKIPCDVIWLDIDFMDGFRVFTFNPMKFPDPPGLAEDLHNQGFRLVCTANPGIRVDPGYFVYDSGTKERAWMLTEDGEPYTGKVWASSCVFPDFTIPRIRAWWADLHPDFLENGVDGLWNDMNEPAIFDGPDMTMPETCRHRGGSGLVPGPHRQYHNIYGMLMIQATREGMLQARPDRRPFLLTRSNFLGGQRFAAMWTGDNYSTETDFRIAVPMTLSMGLSGQPFNGPDLGGFVGDPEPELWARWVAMGAFFPFCRGHSDKGTRKKEPWAFGPEVEHTARLALLRRYRLLPYLYTCFREAASTGLPVMRPLFLADPGNPALRREDQAFMVGGDLLVIPSGIKEPARPRGPWVPFSLVEGDLEDPLQAKLLARGGSILPLGPEVQHTAEAPEGASTLLVCPGEDGVAWGTLYHDAGDGFGYRDGDFRLVTYRAELREERLCLHTVDVQGDRPCPPHPPRVELLTSDGGQRVVHPG